MDSLALQSPQTSAWSTAVPALILAAGVGILGGVLYANHSKLQQVHENPMRRRSGTKPPKRRSSTRRVVPIDIDYRNADTYGQQQKAPRREPNRRVAFRVRLDVGPDYDAVWLRPDNTAILYHYRTAVVRFKPSTYQFRKIRTSSGDLLIYADQIVESLISRRAA